MTRDAEALLAQMTPHRMERGDILFREGDRGDSLYVIAEGKIKLGRTSATAARTSSRSSAPVRCSGELSLFDPGPRTMTATAVAESEVLGLGNDSLSRILGGSPEVPKALLAALAKRLRRTNEHLADLVFTDVPGRVAKALLELSDRFGRPVDGGLLVAHDLTQEGSPSLSGRPARR